MSSKGKGRTLELEQIRKAEERAAHQSSEVRKKSFVTVARDPGRRGRIDRLDHVRSCSSRNSLSKPGKLPPHGPGRTSRCLQRRPTCVRPALWWFGPVGRE